MARIGRDLVAQARMLADRDRRRPKQATLRRAVSTAYYGLFHRHTADYDMSVSFSRHDALNAVTRAEAAVNAWRQLKGGSSEAARLFAMALILWPSLAGR